MKYRSNRLLLSGIAGFLLLALSASYANASCAIESRQIVFAPNRIYLDDATLASLSDLGRTIKSCSSEYAVHIQGYASSVEEPRLAIARAAYVRELLSKAGVPAPNLSSFGRPGVASGRTDADNQVVSITVDEKVASDEQGVRVPNPGAESQRKTTASPGAPPALIATARAKSDRTALATKLSNGKDSPSIASVPAAPPNQLVGRPPRPETVSASVERPSSEQWVKWLVIALALAIAVGTIGVSWKLIRKIPGRRWKWAPTVGPGSSSAIVAARILGWIVSIALFFIAWFKNYFFAPGPLGGLGFISGVRKTY